MRIKEIIKERGLTLKELAARMGVSAPSLGEAVNGNPTVKTLENISRALGVDIIELFDRRNEELYGLIQYKGNTYKIENVESLKQLLSIVEE